MDKEALLANRLPTQPLNIPGVGEITIRALSRAQRGVFAKLADNDVAVFDRKVIAAAMVEPSLTEDEARRWLENAPAGETTIVMEAIGELSGWDREVKELQKAAFKSLREDS